MLVDSHCHLDYDDFQKDFFEIIKRAKDNGVCAMLTAGVNLKDFSKQLDLAKKHPFIWASVGVHPHDAKDYVDLQVDDILKHAYDKNVIAIGECGLDFYYNYSDKDIQIKVFETQIKAAQKSGLPLIFHIRDAEDEFIDIINKYFDIKPFFGVLHCFSGSKKLADFALQKGFYISASGIVTFNKSAELQEIFKSLPLDKIMVETDAPFLAPIPFRGKRNEPCFVKNIAEKIAQLKSVSFEEVANATTSNFFNLFRKASDKK